jgi:hypothetical protein
MTIHQVRVCDICEAKEDPPIVVRDKSDTYAGWFEIRTKRWLQHPNYPRASNPPRYDFCSWECLNTFVQDIKDATCHLTTVRVDEHMRQPRDLYVSPASTRQRAESAPEIERYRTIPSP